MNDESALLLQSLIDRLKRGDSGARNELITRAYDRLRALACKILQDFPNMRGAHDPTSLANQGIVRLMPALEEIQPASVPEFFGFAALQIRRVLLNLARKPGHAGPCDGEPFEPADQTGDPVKLAACAEFHELVNQLPKEEREVIDACFYMGLTQAEAAVLLGIHPKEVSRRWIRAIRCLPPFEP